MADLSSVRAGFRLVRSMVKMHPLPFSIAVAGAALYAGAGVMTSVVFGRVADRVVLPSIDGPAPSTRTLVLTAAAIMGVALARSIGVVTRRFFAGMFSERVSRTLRLQLRDHYLRLPLRSRGDLAVGEMIARADNDTDVMVRVLHPLPFSLGVLFLAVFSAIALLAVDVPLAIVSFLVFPTMTMLNRMYTSRVEAPAAAMQRSVGIASTIAHESFDGALIVKTLGLADREAKRFDVAVDELQGYRQRVGLVRSAFEAGLGTLPYLGIVFVIGVGVFRVESGAVTPGDLIQLASLYMILALPMRVFGFFLQMLPPSQVARDRIAEVLAMPVIVEPHDVRPLGAGPLSLQARGLGFGWPDSDPVLRDVSVSVEAGEVVALVGSTGSGKSTLCEILAGLLTPDDGEVRIDDTPLHQIATAERSNALALVFQESFLFADTIEGNVDLRGNLDPDDVARAIEVAKVSEFVDDLPSGVATVVGERGVTLSGGQRQRVALARALARRPRVIILDDATSAIDAQIEQQILDGLRSFLSATTLVVAQRLSTIRLADRVLWLDGGEIAGMGTHRELLAYPGYEALVTAYEAAR